MTTTAAVVLSGCGVMDGSEIHEAVGVLLALSRAGVRARCFAPDIEQRHVIDHAAGAEAAGETRRVLAESARIARGDIAPLAELNVAEIDALFFPGGFGAAKNLCDFAVTGESCQADPDVARVIREAHAAGKPIGLCCIAPVLAARVLGAESGGPGCTVTVGDDAGVAAAIEKMGATHADRPVTEPAIDEANNLVTVPAYMYGDAPIHDVIDGIAAMVERTLARVPAGSAR